MCLDGKCHTIVQNCINQDIADHPKRVLKCRACNMAYSKRFKETLQRLWQATSGVIMHGHGKNTPGVMNLKPMMFTRVLWFD